MNSAFQLTRQGGLHVGLILLCILYVHVGALFFMYYESPEEERIHRKNTKKFASLRENFLSSVERVKLEDAYDERRVNESVSRLIDEYSKHMFQLFKNPVAANMFDCLFYAKSNYTPLWTTDSSLLFTATTIIPVGYGYIAPLTSTGRIVLCIYAAFGIPLALVMMSDVGKFFADAFVKFFHENITAFMVVLIFLLVAYSLIGGIAYSKVTGVSMIEGIYFSTITIFTIGYGDISFYADLVALFSPFVQFVELLIIFCYQSFQLEGGMYLMKSLLVFNFKVLFPLQFVCFEVRSECGTFKAL
ncbi:CRE-TWK-10 protein [Caenorhabditis remanei]|uniref:CRE-TWK-10 protein n=1 Tax=Caenorhabditis remanei TaxID=31234 RepID=E3LUV3_CAERE|nr:CRE-TWK-10 protein [Caenorhabditis remanei]